MDLYAEISTKIKHLLESKGITSYRLAKDIGISTGDLSGFINNRVRWKVDMLSKISVYFGITLEYLVHGKEFDTDGLIKKQQKTILEMKAQLKEEREKNERLKHVLDALYNYKELETGFVIDDEELLRELSESEIKEITAGQNETRTNYKTDKRKSAVKADIKSDT